MTATELRIRYESGVKVQRRVKDQIKQELTRVCAQHGCHESLAFSNKKKLKCDTHKSIKLAKPLKGTKKRISKVEQRKLNKIKKQRFYERHGIVFNKTIRRKIKTTGIPAEGYEIIYENYKEPLKKIPKAEGFGYYGTLATTADKEYIQCHICGNLFASMGGHLRAHKLSAQEYKDRFQLMTSTALVSDKIRENMQRYVFAVKRGNTELPKHLVEYNKKVQSGEIVVTHGRNSWRLERRNKEGICPDQILTKITDLATKLGHTPSYDEFRLHYHNRYHGSLVYQHGSYLNAVRKAKLTPARDIWHPSKEKLLQDLIDFKEKHGRIPMGSDFKRGLLYPRQAYWRAFGSINNARVEAGMEAVLPLPFGRKVLMQPDEYIKYIASKELKNGTSRR